MAQSPAQEEGPITEDLLQPEDLFPEIPEIKVEDLITEDTLPAPARRLPPGAKCFSVFNQAPYSIIGSFYTNYYITKEGIKARHQSNFRLQSQEKAEFCSYGPFYGEEEDYLYFVLRTIIPILYCYIRLDEDIVVHGRRKPEGGTETWTPACIEKAVETSQGTE